MNTAADNFNFFFIKKKWNYENSTLWTLSIDNSNVDNSPKNCLITYAYKVWTEQRTKFLNNYTLNSQDTVVKAILYIYMYFDSTAFFYDLWTLVIDKAFSGHWGL